MTLRTLFTRNRQQSAVVPGAAVKLADDRVGTVEYVWQSPYYGETRLQRAYVVGLGKEFADWVLPNEIVTVYGDVSADADQSGAAENAAEATFSA